VSGSLPSSSVRSASAVESGSGASTPTRSASEEHSPRVFPASPGTVPQVVVEPLASPEGGTTNKTLSRSASFEVALFVNREAMVGTSPGRQSGETPE